jgi:cell wall-associated NlpC family hydrolase
LHLSATGPSKCEQIKKAANIAKGTDYVWGGESLYKGSDCSGFIYAVQKYIGQPVPRTTAKKYAILADGKRKHWSKGSCGNWIWWTFSPDRPFGHIGIHIEQPYVWQSGSSTGPSKEKLFRGSFWDKNFEVTKALKAE